MGLTTYYSLDAPDADDPIYTSQSAIANAFVTIDAELKRIADLVAALPQGNVTGLVSALSAKIAASVLDANTILYATADDTPAALPVAASRLVGRKATGDIDDLTAAEAKAVLQTASTYERVYTTVAPGTSITLNMDDYDVFDITLDQTTALAITMSATNPGAGNFRQVMIILRRPEGLSGLEDPTWTNVPDWDAADLAPSMPGDANRYILAGVWTTNGTTFQGTAATEIPKSKQWPLPLAAFDLPDGSGSGNAFPTPVYVQSAGTQTTNAPKAFARGFAFDASTDQHILTAFQIPRNYVDSGSVRFKFTSEGTTGDVVFKASMARLVASSTDLDSGNTLFDTVATSGVLTVPGTVGQNKECTITLSSPGVFTPNELCVLMVGRDADNASDTSSARAIIVSDVTFDYRGND